MIRPGFGQIIEIRREYQRLGLALAGRIDSHGHKGRELDLDGDFFDRRHEIMNAVVIFSQDCGKQP